MLKCQKCGCTTFKISKDGRGIAEARCNDCGAFVKKMSAAEVIDYYERELAEATKVESKEAAEPDKEVARRPCKYCAENFFMRQGRLGTVYIPLPAEFCPMCGRKLQESDRAY